MLKKNGYSPDSGTRKASQAVQTGKDIILNITAPIPQATRITQKGSPKSTPPRTFARPTVTIADEVKRIE
jgi:hypothetical protein